MRPVARMTQRQGLPRRGAASGPLATLKGRPYLRRALLVFSFFAAIELVLFVGKIDNLHVYEVPHALAGYLAIYEPCSTPEKDLKDLETLVLIADDVCKENNLVCWADFGTLLGSSRHGTVIPWDTDADYSAMMKDRDLLSRALTAKGINVTRRDGCKLRAWMPDNPGRTLDIFLHLIRESDNMVVRCEINDIERYQFEAHFLEPLEQAPFGPAGRTINAPNHQPDFLIVRFSFTHNFVVPRKFRCYFTTPKLFFTFLIIMAITVVPLGAVLCLICRMVW
eukprot:Opistho-2@40418